jgi:hypothetical protein
MSSAALLRHAFAGAPDAFRIPPSDRARVNGHDPAASAATYGELTVAGSSTLFHALRIDEHSTFVDLGSGRGRVVLQAALESTARLAVGIELSQRRHAIAQRALTRLTATHASLPRRVRFACEDIAAAAWELDATEVFVANLLFPPALNDAVARRLARAAQLRRVATLKPLDPVPPNLTFACRLKLAFSWAERCSVHVYEQRRSGGRSQRGAVGGAARS